MENFENLRNTFVWGSFGRNHDEKVKYTHLKDISDSHLLHIIPWVENGGYDEEIIEIFKAEQTYRFKKNIYVPEYEDNKKESTYHVNVETEGLDNTVNINVTSIAIIEKICVESLILKEESYLPIIIIDHMDLL